MLCDKTVAPTHPTRERPRTATKTQHGQINTLKKKKTPEQRAQRRGCCQSCACQTGGRAGGQEGDGAVQARMEGVSDLTVIFPMEKDFYRKG